MFQKPELEVTSQREPDVANVLPPLQVSPSWRLQEEEERYLFMTELFFHTGVGLLLLMRIFSHQVMLFI